MVEELGGFLCIQTRVGFELHGDRRFTIFLQGPLLILIGPVEDRIIPGNPVKEQRLAWFDINRVAGGFRLVADDVGKIRLVNVSAFVQYRVFIVPVDVERDV